MLKLSPHHLHLLAGQPGHIRIALRRLGQHGAQLESPDIGLVADLVGDGELAALPAQLGMTEAGEGIGEFGIEVATSALGGCAEGAPGLELVAGGMVVDGLELFGHGEYFGGHGEGGKE